MAHDITDRFEKLTMPMLCLLDTKHRSDALSSYKGEISINTVLLVVGHFFHRDTAEERSCCHSQISA